MAVPIAIFDWESFPVRAWGLLTVLGLGQLFSRIVIVVTYRYASAGKVGPFIYSVIVFTPLIDWLVRNLAPTLFMYLGRPLSSVVGSWRFARNPCAVALQEPAETSPSQLGRVVADSTTTYSDQLDASA